MQKICRALICAEKSFDSAHELAILSSESSLLDSHNSPPTFCAGEFHDLTSDSSKKSTVSHLTLHKVQLSDFAHLFAILTLESSSVSSTPHWHMNET